MNTDTANDTPKPTSDEANSVRAVEQEGVQLDAHTGEQAAVRAAPEHKPKPAFCLARYDTDPRPIANALRATILTFLWQAGYGDKRNVALRAFPWKPLPAALRAAQRALHMAHKDGLINMHVVNSACVLYGLNKAGANWLAAHTAIANATSTGSAAREAKLITHRLTTNLIGIVGQLLGCTVRFERDLLKAHEWWEGTFKKIPDVLMTWRESARAGLGPNAAVTSQNRASWHELDLSRRTAKGYAGLSYCLHELAVAKGKLKETDSDPAYLRAFVFHVGGEGVEKSLREQLRQIWAFRRFGPFDPKADVHTILHEGEPVPFKVIIERAPPPDYWPQDVCSTDAFIVPWCMNHGVALPFQYEWAERREAALAVLDDDTSMVDDADAAEERYLRQMWAIYPNATRPKPLQLADVEWLRRSRRANERKKAEKAAARAKILRNADRGTT